MRLFTGDVERGCSGTTPGRKLEEHTFVGFIRDLLQGPQARLGSSLFIDVGHLSKQHIGIIGICNPRN